MSRSREFAMMDDGQYLDAMMDLARSCLRACGGNVSGGQYEFEREVRSILHALHAAGWSRERLREKRREARRAFHLAPGSSGAEKTKA